MNSSSLERNDITSYFSCQNGNNTNFYVITFKPINATEERIKGNYDINYNLYGICIYNNSLKCTDSDIKKYLKKVAKITDISTGKIMKIFNMNKVSKTKIEMIHIIMISFFATFFKYFFISESVHFNELL